MNRNPIDIDVIILSYAKDNSLRKLTEQTIVSIIESEDPNIINFNILVIESNRDSLPYEYISTKTIYPNEKFGYNKFMNLGLKLTSSKFVCLSNNDVIYQKHWASEIINFAKINPDILSFTPYCLNYHKNIAKIDSESSPIEAYYGLLMGWCLIMKREVFSIIGELDENFTFWYSDYDYLKTIEKFKVKNFLVPKSKILHLGSESLKKTDSKTYQKLTRLPHLYFDYKWRHQSKVLYYLKKIHFHFFNQLT